MTTPAAAIKTEIRELIDLQIHVFGQHARLTPFELEDCSRRAERIKSLGRKLDQLRISTIQLEEWRKMLWATRRPTRIHLLYVCRSCTGSKLLEFHGPFCHAGGRGFESHRSRHLCFCCGVRRVRESEKRSPEVC